MNDRPGNWRRFHRLSIHNPSGRVHLYDKTTIEITAICQGIPVWQSSILADYRLLARWGCEKSNAVNMTELSRILRERDIRIDMIVPDRQKDNALSKGMDDSKIMASLEAHAYRNRTT
ncbi:hypothetical protein CC2G_004664 [Coprinopsis cinerea AmutBmut pab1-1]|nr:hypothetical protein CC2G_004664 [Coprinopsis cinerea AmutBmut pab1-1]